MLLQEIKNSLQSISEFNIEEIIDVSYSHRGHQSVKNSKDQLTHIEIIVSFFEKNISRIEVHRKIYGKLQKFIDNGLHSISIKIAK
ncbi:MAG: BolA/IbaG family iron-sulfur metabolism protein [Alphaproteobacteria bacterium]|nr:BolA/IbaG family iron-sulfur metabolism protein [Alphaproteobacteria bacterium]